MEKKKSRLRTLVSLNHYAWNKLEQLSAIQEKPFATLCSEIIKAAMRGELLDRNGNNPWEAPPNAKPNASLQ